MDRPKNLGELLNCHSGNKTAVAKELGVNRWRVWEWVKDLKVKELRDKARAERNTDVKIRRIQHDLESERARRVAAESDLEAIQTASEVLLASSNVDPVIISPDKKGHDSKAVAIILASDWHAEANIPAESVSNINRFDLEICTERVKRLFSKAVYLTKFASNICKIDEMVLWLGGDLINGFIHEELQEGNFLGPAEAVVFVCNLVEGGIDYLLDFRQIKKLHVVCSIGNHGRSTQKVRVSTGWRSSWEYLAYKMLSGRLTDNRITWHIPTCYHAYVDVLGHMCRFHHGDALRYNGGVGGITIPVNKAISQWNQMKHAEYDFFGHYHQFIDSWHWVCNGSLVGFDPYAISIKAPYQPPTQTFCVIDQSRGKTMAIPIFLE